ncbi:C39 family peptidase [Paenibacillus thiaminolyticus]|uniref:C39 family peptidase n=1 Tax=Paenibacillus thiaminolyticus TaxID=49283 RepID=UPI0035A6F895
MKRKLFSVLMSACILTSTFATTAFAEEAGQADNYLEVENGSARAELSRAAATVNTGLLDETEETVEEQVAAIEASDLTDENKAVAIEKLLAEGDDNEITTRATTWKYLDGFLVWKQSESYYCVPASCKAAVHYLTGSSDSQATIAKALGTTSSGTPFSQAKTYLNNKQSANTYVSKASSTTLSTMQSNFYSAIHTYAAPPLISVKLSTSSGWAYNTSGHTMLVTGARSDKEQFRIADPYIQWADSSANMYYSKTASAIQTAISNRGNGYIY